MKPTDWTAQDDADAAELMRDEPCGECGHPLRAHDHFGCPVPPAPDTRPVTIPRALTSPAELRALARYGRRAGFAIVPRAGLYIATSSPRTKTRSGQPRTFTLTVLGCSCRQFGLLGSCPHHALLLDDLDLIAA